MRVYVGPEMWSEVLERLACRVLTYLQHQFPGKQFVQRTGTYTSGDPEFAPSLPYYAVGELVQSRFLWIFRRKVFNPLFIVLDPKQELYGDFGTRIDCYLDASMDLQEPIARYLVAIGREHPRLRVESSLHLFIPEWV